ncbi:GNAT family N-acetyltransferase [Frigidibacter sp. RF13]|uniref:GNAT family N-acetyltransferase n=1 Tax=Frigidibacter sp. RF13 TaxID=2997340 RepID=UPI00227075E2|nr:GNAT family N-acetyltransferase [Frigidibacter sp. RF13]MCY1128050.1 GNAT family N-acetyltransferase [Frigidibacter sp. RF13]
MTITLANTPVLQTERLTLRAPSSADWSAFDAFLATPRATFIRSGDYGIRETWRAFGHVIGHWVMRGFGNFVFTLRGEDRPLGMAGPWFPAGWPEQEIGWTVWSGEAEGKGYAAEAASAARRFAYDRLGWTTAVSYIDPSNHRSIALAERLGARLDAGAAHPAGDKPCLVYRHPGPEALV